MPVAPSTVAVTRVVRLVMRTETAITTVSRGSWKGATSVNQCAERCRRYPFITASYTLSRFPPMIPSTAAPS